MKSLLIFVCLILFISALEDTPSSCDYASTVNQVKSLSDCQQILKDDTENKCCLGIQYMYGQNLYFCHQFNKTATQSEVNSVIEDLYVNKTLEQYYGLFVKARGSCETEVKPFEPENKCSIEDTQRSSVREIIDCTSNEKEKSSDYCCLFTGVVRDSEQRETKVNFCKELNEDQVNDMDEAISRIEIDTRMVDVKNQNCSSPKKDEPSFSSNINCNLFIFGLLLILIL